MTFAGRRLTAGCTFNKTIEQHLTCRVLDDMNCISATLPATSSTLTMTRDISEVQDDFELPPLDNRLVASAAAVLDAAQVPFVLWGNYMLTVFGIPSVVNVRTSRQSELTSSNAYTRASISLSMMTSWLLPTTPFEVPVSRIASQEVASATKYFLILQPLTSISTSRSSNCWASTKNPTFCGGSRICQTWTAKALF